MSNLTSLANVIDADCIIGDEQGMAGYISEPRKRFSTRAHAVVLPKTIEELQAIVKWANANKAPLIPQGGNTGLVGGQVPLFGTEIIVSLSRLNRLREIDVTGGNMCVEAGMVLHQAHKVAEQNDRLFPLSIASEGSAQIGGVLSTNAGGVQVLSYGNARQLCLGIEAVLPDGSIYQGLNALKKNNTGYDLSNLLVGAEGTLGFITAATLKLFTRPQAFETAWINVASPLAALKLFNTAQSHAGSSLSAFELMPRIGIDLQLKHDMIPRDPSASASDWYVLAEISHRENSQTDMLSQILESALNDGLIENATLAQSMGEKNNMWAAREQMSASQSREGASIKHDVSVPISAVPDLIERGSEVAGRIVSGIRPCPFGHLGDGNIHFNFSQPIGADPVKFMAGAEAVHRAIYDIVLSLGGSISAEHGIGQLKVDLLQNVKDPVALQAMRDIKQALDPNNICNPGKILKQI